MTDLGQIITAMVTPFEAGNKSQIDYDATGKLIEHLVNNGSSAIIISGTTGESPTLSHDEEIELLKFAKNKLAELNASTKLVFGAGSNSTQTSITMSKRAEEVGVDALLIVTPYYNKPNQAGLRAHYSLIAQATDLPIILYNVPSRTNISLTADTIIELYRDYPQICMLKEASSNIDIISQIRGQLSAAEFAIYSGDDSLTLPMMAVGAQGVISVASHLVGNEMQEMLNAFKQGELSKAQQIQYKLMPLFDNLFVEPNPTCVKAALAITGLCSAELREPLVPLSAKQEAKLKQVIQKLELQTQ
ncbi:MAG: 4-hydroxy-tetrahydrodipicolinate synthase [Candidatus Melainabacteria bacterium]|nr:4-hydroxy-tetrahydrodipicolinate synthase [Candidatus Melainabacteria bacterium]